MAAASCSIYENNGSVPLTTELPEAVQISIPSQGTDLAVIWNPDDALALIVFRGTTTNKGWVTVRPFAFHVVGLVEQVPLEPTTIK
jgi:hypothetical protein